jgi:hypothetical protein
MALRLHCLLLTDGPMPDDNAGVAAEQGDTDGGGNHRADYLRGQPHAATKGLGTRAHALKCRLLCTYDDAVHGTVDFAPCTLSGDRWDSTVVLKSTASWTCWPKKSVFSQIGSLKRFLRTNVTTTGRYHAWHWNGCLVSAHNVYTAD